MIGETFGWNETVHVYSEAVRVHVHDGTAMTPATSKSTNLDFSVEFRDEKKTAYGYVYEYVYGEDTEIRTKASSRRLQSGAAHAIRSA